MYNIDTVLGIFYMCIVCIIMIIYIYLIMMKYACMFKIIISNIHQKKSYN